MWRNARTFNPACSASGVLTPRVCVPAEVELPETAKVKASTDENFKEDSEVKLEALVLAPGGALLLQFPHSV